MRTTPFAALMLFSGAGLLPGLFLPATSEAAPKGATVVRGPASIQENGSITNIRAGDGAIIEYSSFEVGKGETVNFITPSARARVLNRVTGGEPSQIFGQVNSSSTVYLVNRNGIYFQHDAQVQMGNFYAVAGQLSTRDFLRRLDRFTDVSGEVSNHARLAAGTGLHLVGRQVENDGTLTTARGSVLAAAGSEVMIGANDSRFIMGPGGAEAGDNLTGLKNAGQVEAPRTLFSAGAGYAVALENTGVVRSQRLTLEGGATGVVKLSGTLDATLPAATARGGLLTVTGGAITLQGATLDASGARGGGLVQVGGGLQGRGPLLQAKTTEVDAASVLKANATVHGAGGRVVLWSTEKTDFQGTLEAVGVQAPPSARLRGPVTGGLAEISSKGTLGFTGTTDLHGGNGAPGRLLLDPQKLVVSEGGEKMTTPFVGAASLRGALRSAVVTLQAEQEVVFAQPFSTWQPERLVLQAGGAVVGGQGE